MTRLSRDARFFVEGVTRYLRGGGADSRILPKVTAAIHNLTVSAQTQKTALVQSVVALSPKEKAQVSQFLSRLLTHSVTLDCTINKDLIGGLRIQVGDWIVNTTVAGQIEAMKEQLTS